MALVLGRPAAPPQPLFLAQLNPGVRMFSMGTPRGEASESEDEDASDGRKQHFMGTVVTGCRMFSMGTPPGSTSASATSSRCSSRSATPRQKDGKASSATTGSTRSCGSSTGDTPSVKKVQFMMTGSSAQTSRSSSVASCSSRRHEASSDPPGPTANELLAAVMNNYAHLQGDAPADADVIAMLDDHLDFSDIDL